MIRTLVFALLLVMGALAVVTATVAAVRRQRHLGFYASGYVAGMGGLLLLSGQGWLHPALSVVAANLLLSWFPLALVVGLRLWMKAPRLWPRRFGLYILAMAVGLVAGTTLWPSYLFRAVVVSALCIVATIDVILAVALSVKHLPRVLTGALWALGGGFLVCNVVRLVLLGLQGPVASTMMADTPANFFSFGYSLVFCVLWVGLVLVIDSAELVVALRAKNAELAALATTDALTGVGNRQALDAQVQTEMERAHRYGQPLCLLIFDLDYFKAVNDTWGHETGDQVLRATARTSQAQVRDSDSVFRWGGEEFLVLTPHTDLEGAWALAEKLRLAVSAQNHPRVGTVTASFGVTEWDYAASWEVWFHRADQALYHAKRDGRNRVEVWTRHDTQVPLRLKLEWSSAWESGNPGIDADHRRLVELANDLLGRALGSPESPELSPTVDALVAHILEHFAEEEAVLDAQHYPGAQAHKERHCALVAELRSLEGALGRGEVKAMDLCQFVVGTMILDHMLTDDAAFFGYTRPTQPSPSRLVRSRS